MNNNKGKKKKKLKKNTIGMCDDVNAFVAIARFFP